MLAPRRVCAYAACMRTIVSFELVATAHVVRDGKCYADHERIAGVRVDVTGSDSAQRGVPAALKSLARLAVSPECTRRVAKLVRKARRT